MRGSADKSDAGHSIIVLNYCGWPARGQVLGDCLRQAGRKLPSGSVCRCGHRSIACLWSRIKGPLRRTHGRLSAGERSVWIYLPAQCARHCAVCKILYLSETVVCKQTIGPKRPADVTNRARQVLARSRERASGASVGESDRHRSPHRGAARSGCPRSPDRLPAIGVGRLTVPGWPR